MRIKFGKKKKKEKLTPEEIETNREINDKKDILWSIMLLYLYLIPFTAKFLIDRHALNIWTEIPLGIIFAAFLIKGPHLFYSSAHVRDYFAAFNGKAASSSNPEERGRGAFIYNVVYFVALAVIGYFLSLYISGFVFHKNRIVFTALLVIFDIAALYISGWLTDRKYKTKRGSNKNV